MRKVSCIFHSSDDAQRAKSKLISECGGECRVSVTEEKSNIFANFPASTIPANFGVNTAPQTSALDGSWQIIPFEINSNKHKREDYPLVYIGFDDQAKKAEALLINLGGSSVKNTSYPV